MTTSYGDLTFTTDTYLSGITELKATLTISGGVTVNVPNLVSVENIVVGGGGKLYAPNLKHITDLLTLKGEKSTLVACHLNEVKHVEILEGAEWKVHNNFKVTGYIMVDDSYFEAIELLAISGDCYAQARSVVILPKLTHVLGAMTIDIDAEFTSLERAGELCIGDNSVVTLSSLRHIDGDLTLHDSSNLEANNLVSIQDSLKMHRFSKLTARKLEVIHGELDKPDNATLDAPLMGIDSINTGNIEKVLTDRGGRYGEFKDNAVISQSLKDTMSKSVNWERLEPYQKEALEMIAHKIARILNGDITYVDSWTDICGYSKLVESRLSGSEVK